MNTSMSLPRHEKSTSIGSRTVYGTYETKGNTHIPKEVSEFLGLKPSDRIEYRFEDDKVVIGSAPMTLEEACGSVTPLQPGRDLEEVIREAKEEYYTQRWQRIQSYE